MDSEPLGHGLGALVTKMNSSTNRLNINSLTPNPLQPRKSFDEQGLQELAQSIKSHGILQPILVKKEGEHYQIVSGERRWRAAKLAGLRDIPVRLLKVTDGESLEVALIENIQREDLSPIEEAKAFEHLMSRFHYTQDEVAEKVGKDRSSVANLLRVLSLPHSIQEALSIHKISLGHAKLICSLGHPKLQLEVFKIVAQKKLSVRQTEALVKKVMESGGIPRPTPKEISPDLRHICDQFKGHLGTKVKITGNNNKGKIEISYYTDEDLERIIDLVLGNPLDELTPGRH